MSFKSVISMFSIMVFVGCSNTPTHQKVVDIPKAVTFKAVKTNPKEGGYCIVSGELTNNTSNVFNGRVGYSVLVKDKKGNQIGSVEVHFNPVNLEPNASVTSYDYPDNYLGGFGELARLACDRVASFELVEAFLLERGRGKYSRRR